MKRKAEFEVRKIGDVNMVMPLDGKASLTSVMTLNESGMFIWDMLESDVTVADIAIAMAEEYNAPVAVIEEDVKAFISKMLRVGLIEE